MYRTFILLLILCLPTTVRSQEPVAPSNISAAAQIRAARRSEVHLDDRDRLFGCDFDADADVNYDQFPDSWRRQTGFGFPKYNELKIVPDSEQQSNSVMELALDGQKAAIYSPEIEVGQQFSYVLNAKCRVAVKEGHNCRAWASIVFMDAEKNPISSFTTPVLSKKDGWYHLSTKVLILENSSITHAVVGLHVEPLEETSLFGKCWFDDVAVYQLPRIVLETGHPLNIFTDPKQVELRCQVSGARRKDAGLRMELYDERGNLLRADEQSLLPGEAAERLFMNADGTFQNFAVKHLAWRLVDEENPLAGTSDLHGYYRLVIKLLDRDTRQMVRELSFVVVDPAEAPTDTMFGWTLDKRIYEIDQNMLVNSLRQLGVNWVKLPVWIDVDDYLKLENLGGLLQKLNRYAIDVVGVLDDPPQSIYEKFWQHEQGMAALTSDIKLFQAAIEPVMTQLSLRIGRWQLGSDDDTSVAEDLEHIDKMLTMKEFFVKYGEESKVGLPWTWMLQRVNAEEQSWDFTSNVAYPELSATEMGNYTSDIKEAKGRESYISLQPLPSYEYDLQTRVRDYAARFVEIKRLGIQRVFAPRPFDDDSGFFREGSQPTELLCPWRTLAVELNGASYMGSFQMPGNSENHVFQKNGTAMMLVWNDTPTEETLYLGQRVRVLDLWGRQLDVPTDGVRHSLQVDGWPLLVKNMDLSVAIIRHTIAFDRDSIDSVLGQKQALTLSFRNGFPRGISGAISMVNETLFSPEYTIGFKAGRGEDYAYTIPMQVNQDALTGKQLVKLDFQFHNEELATFSAWQPLTIGLKDVEFATRTGMVDENQFVIKMTLINRSDQPVSYAVYLFVPGKKRMSIMFNNVKPGQQSKTFRVYNAAELKGKSLWLSARETKRNRNLNYQIPVE